MDDEKIMRRALELAARAEGDVSPRPSVGAVVVGPNGEVVAEGYTRPRPGPHAEADALARAGDRAGGSTVYVSLEPCVESSVSTSCAEALVAAGVRRVVAATRDPNPVVDGRGFALLRRSGIDVVEGVCEDQARRHVAPFAKWIRTGRPLLTLKLAMTLDGKTAAPDGTSRWITGPAARAEVHALRRRVDAVIVGSGTVDADDPSLTFREPGMEGTQPTRVLIDSSGRTPATAKIFDGDAPALVMTTRDRDVSLWNATSAEVIRVAAADGGVDLGEVLEELGRRGMCHVLCEAGPRLAGAFVAGDLVDRFRFYVAPKLIGGDAPGVLAGGVKTLTDAWELEIDGVDVVGGDIRIDARPAGRES